MLLILIKVSLLLLVSTIYNDETITWVNNAFLVAAPCEKNLHDQEQVSIAGSARAAAALPASFGGLGSLLQQLHAQYLQICSTDDLENPCQHFIGLIYALGVALG